MFFKRVKRKCHVRGCKNIDSFAISRTREVGNTVIICKSCLERALGAIGEVEPSSKSNIPELDSSEAPPLFFNTLIEQKPTAMQEESTAIEQAYTCGGCGKEFKNENGLKAHQRYCKAAESAENKK